MTGSTFGKLLRITTWGESHGKAIGAVVDGCPSCIELSEKDIQKDLDRRKPGQSSITTQRKEQDIVEILSGTFNGKTTGAPISLVIKNKDADSSKYEKIKHLFRPGHADFTFQKKYNIRDYRGGGRSSARETAARVAAGTIAKKIIHNINPNVKFIAHALKIGDVTAEKLNFSEIEKNKARCADKAAAKKMEELILSSKQKGDSIGGIVGLIIKNCPVGLGDPVFDKLDADLAKALISIGAVKGIEIGAGFNCAKMKGSESNDYITTQGFASNNSGGILGGISTGQDIVIRIAVKPTPSISQEQSTIDLAGKAQKICIEGRHDPCIVPRIIPIAEAMAALVIADKMLIQRCIER
ncbi:MAG: chorismate synthase [Candidatus Woesearchaeota archaeon]